jgi:hypothetical protein
MVVMLFHILQKKKKKSCILEGGNITVRHFRALAFHGFLLSTVLFFYTREGYFATVSEHGISAIYSYALTPVEIVRQ